MIGGDVIQIAAEFFSWVGALITIYGGLEAIVRILQKEVLRRELRYTDIRLEFTNKIVFGLEFFIASDVLTTLITPMVGGTGYEDELNKLLLLGAVVAIRIVLGYFLEKEAKEFRVD
jgi:uncharacterized membrane protein